MPLQAPPNPPSLQSHDREHLRARRAAARRRVQKRRRIAAAAAVAVLAGAAALLVVILSGGGENQPAPAGGQAASAGGKGAGAGPAAAASTGAAVPLRIAPARPGRATVVTHGPRRPEVALTFDDGFCRTCVAALVRAVQRTGAHVTFFPNGTYATAWEPQAAAIKRLIAKGQVTVGNHTFSHGNAVSEGSAAFAADLARNERWIEKTFGVSGRPYYRPPYGAVGGDSLAVAGRQGYTKVIMWSGTLADSNVRSVPYVVKAVKDWAKPGAIILGHGNYPATPAGLPKMLAVLKAKGLRTVTIAEMLGGPAAQRG
jgi:peptidoglycan-N-acetylglucosamine deacetylase